MMEATSVNAEGRSGFLSRQLLREERQAEVLRQAARDRRTFVAGREGPCSGCGAGACNMALEVFVDEFGDRERRCRLCSGVDYLAEAV